jgi:AcrR family transcriptional regulator
MVNNILEAAARILDLEGMAEFNTNAIAQRAGVSVGSVYQYFPSKEAVLVELIRQMRAGLVQSLQRQEQLTRGLDLSAALDGFIRAAVTNQLARSQLTRILEYVEAVSAVDGETETLKLTIVATVTAALADRGVADPATAARDIVALTLGMVDAAGLFGDAGRATLEGRIRRAVYGYLGLPLPVPLPVPVPAPLPCARREGRMALGA